MNGLPPETDLRFLLGRTLHEVGVGLTGAALRFDGSVAIDVGCDFVYSSDDEQAWGAGDNPPSLASLLPLLGERVTDARNRGEGELELTFTGGHTLNLFDSDVSGESYTITGPGRTIVV